MFIGWLPYGITVSTIVEKLKLPTNLVFFLLVPYVIALFAVRIRLSLFPCPRCKEPFFTRRLGWFPVFSNEMSKKCIHCGLPRYASSDPGPEQEKEFRSSSSIAGRIFDRCAVPLGASTAVLSTAFFVICLLTPDLDEATYAWMIGGTSVLAGIGALLSMAAVATLRRRNVLSLMKSSAPSWIKVCLPLLLLVLVLTGAVRMVITSKKILNPVEAQDVFRTPKSHFPSPIEYFGSALLSIMMLYGAAKVRYAAQMGYCTNGHATPIKESACTTCGQPIKIQP